MFIPRSNRLVVMLVIILLSCTSKTVFSINNESLNGTWVYSKNLFKSNKIEDWSYSWGVGKSIVETTLEIDIAKKEALLPGTGLFFIQRISKESDSNVSVDIKGPGENGGWEMRLIFHFLDWDTFWIECPDLEGMFSVGEKKPWYRLSGPSR